MEMSKISSHLKKKEHTTWSFGSSCSWLLSEDNKCFLTLQSSMTLNIFSKVSHATRMTATRRRKKKRLPHQFVSRFCKLPKQLLKKSHRFTHQLSNRRKRHPLLSSDEVCFPRSLSPDPSPSRTSPQWCLRRGYSSKAGEGVSAQLCIPLGWGHRLNRSPLGGPLVPPTLQKGR